ncbi:MAG: hypothetical protein H0X64_03995 [Gemmatimonadaceae bacterium]|nr:hypothetical protein [Gemmatimonadaceae bacterium]
MAERSHTPRMHRLARNTLAFAAVAALTATLPSCSARTRPAPDSERLPSPEAAPVEGRAQARESEPGLHPASVVACQVTGRTAVEADSVALRFVAAFLRVGVLPIRLTLPSTGGVQAGPVEVTTPVHSTLSARATTGSDGDHAAYRVEFRVAPVGSAWSSGDSAAAVRSAEPLCGRVGRLVFP